MNQNLNGRAENYYYFLDLDMLYILVFYYLFCPSFYRQLHRRKLMEQDSIWFLYSNQEKGSKLLESEATQVGTQNSMKAVLYDKLILFDQMCIQFNFDMKFGIKEGVITFEIGPTPLSFTLTKNDDKEWKSILKKHLNQKGFHETFKPIKKIGKGNFASVYLVERIENKCKYAVKAFSKQAAYSQQNGKQCLIKQIEIMRNLNHHSLMKLQEVFESDNSLYIVFQLLEGGQLYDKIKQKYQFKPCQTQKMMRDLLEGLKEMHSKGIMHRDLKPQNILLRQKTGVECVIADFGLAEFTSSEEYLFVRCGTPGYVAPEVINIKDMKQKYGSICDIFSLGLIFHVFLFGHSVFKKKTYQEVLAENRACTFTLDGELYDSISSETLDLLKKMLRVNPEQRITAEQALDHPYFKSEPGQLNMLKQKISNTSTQDNSPLLKQNIKGHRLQKDSCIEFKMGKQNVMNGNLDTVADVNKTKVSMFGQAMTPGRVSKISKFSRSN